MTIEQYEKYKKLEEEIKPVKDFLFWCGDRYKCEKVECEYRFNIVTKLEDFFLHRKGGLGNVERNDYKIPEELQKRIVTVLEEYMDEVEKEMEEI